MPSPSPKFDDILSSVRKLIDERGPHADTDDVSPEVSGTQEDAVSDAPDPAPSRPPALLLSAENLVSLPAPEASDRDASARGLPSKRHMVPPAGARPDRDMPRIAGARLAEGLDQWGQRSGRVTSPQMIAGDDDAKRFGARHGVEDTTDVAGTEDDAGTPDPAIDRIAEAARRASARHAALRAESPLENLFAPQATAVPATMDGPEWDGPGEDDELAEHLADVVRHQIAETLPQQITELAPHLLDEDVLRPVVADLIRKELAGAFGARITQGVRKLVRQEVNRAISLRRLE